MQAERLAHVDSGLIKEINHVVWLCVVWLCFLWLCIVWLCILCSAQQLLLFRSLLKICFQSCLGAIHKGRPKRGGGGMVKWGHLRTGRGKGTCGHPQDGTFSELFQHALQTLPMGDGYKSINYYLSYSICTTEYNMGWHQGLRLS